MIRLFIVHVCCILITVGCQAAEPKGGMKDISVHEDKADGIKAKPNDKVTSKGPDTIAGRHILFPNLPYPIRSEADRVSNTINDDWYALWYIPEHDFFLMDYANYEVEKNVSGHSSGIPTETLVTGEEILFFLNIPEPFFGAPNVVHIPHGTLFPGDSIHFDVQESSCMVIASGNSFHDISQGQSGSFQLDLYENGQFVQQLLNQSEYKDTTTEIFRVLYLNEDSKPDYILSSPRHPEEHRVIIWLSDSTGYTKYEEVLELDR